MNKIQSDHYILNTFGKHFFEVLQELIPKSTQYEVTEMKWKFPDFSLSKEAVSAGRIQWATHPLYFKDVNYLQATQKYFPQFTLTYMLTDL